MDLNLETNSLQYVRGTTRSL